MPTRAKRVCNQAGCSALVQPPEKYCPKHKRNVSAAEAEANRAYDKRRPEEHAFYHSQQWQQVRSLYLMAHPLCEDCLHNGVIVPAQMVDHIQEIRDGGAKTSQDNLRALCFACHNKKTARVKLHRSNTL